MTGAQVSSMDRTRGARLLALLFALLLSVTSVVGHAAMEICAPDCTVAQTEMLEASDLECGVYAISTPLLASPAARPESLAKMAVPGPLHQIATPPRRPPRV